MTASDCQGSATSEGRVNDPRAGAVPAPEARRLRVLFFVEGFTDIRLVKGLSEIVDVTMAVPAGHYEQSQLKQRVAEEGLRLRVDEIPGGRPA